MAIPLPEARCFHGGYPFRGWLPSEFVVDEALKKELDAGKRSPAAVLEAIDQLNLRAYGLADASVIDAMEEIEGTETPRLVIDRSMVIDFGSDSSGRRLRSDPVPEAALLWGRLYWQESGRRDPTFQELVRVAPFMALRLLEDGFEISRHDAPPLHIPFGPIEPPSLQPLLAHPSNSIRTQAMLLASRFSSSPPTRGRSHA